MNKVYLNFPISLLRGCINKPKECMQHIMDYTATVMANDMPFDTIEDQKRVTEQYFNITYANFKRTLERGNKLIKNTPLKMPSTGINKGILFDYYENLKDEFQTVCLFAVCGMKSIVGKKTHCMTNRYLVLARMLGFPTLADYEAYATIDERKIFNKYETKRMFAKLKNELCRSWYLKTAHEQGMRSFMFTFSPTVSEAYLIEKAMLSTKKVKDLALKQKKDEARQTAIQNLKNKGIDLGL